jgi:hypothetical protein
MIDILTYYDAINLSKWNQIQNDRNSSLNNLLE